MRRSRTDAIALSRFSGRCGPRSGEIEMEDFDSETGLQESDTAAATATEYDPDIDTGTALALGLSNEWTRVETK